MTSLVPSTTSVGAVDDRDAHTTRTLDRIAHLAALATGASIAQINVLAEDRHIPVAVHASRSGVDLGVACFKPDLDADESFAVEDTRAYPLATHVHDESADGVRAYAAARLRTPAGVVLGTVCVADFEPRLWTQSEREALAECAALAGEELASQMSYVTTARARLQAQRAQADAETASRAKSEFMATLSRELRSQLDVLGGYVELLESQPTTRQDELRRLQLGQRQLVALVDDVLDYSGLEHGSAAFSLAAVGVREALAEAEAAVTPQVRGKALFLSMGDSRDDLAVTADVEKLRQILTNLLSNAVRFTGPGGRIDVCYDATRTDVRIRIHDTGVGIPADKLDVIFEPFVQLRADPDRTVAHAGLGLAISRALARGQGGDLTAESTVGAGSTFTLTLPRAKRAN